MPHQRRRAADDLAQHGGDVGGELPEQVGAGGAVGAAVAAEVDLHDPALGGDRRRQPVPDRAARRDAVQEHDRMPVGGPGEVDVDADPTAVDPHDCSSAYHHRRLPSSISAGHARLDRDDSGRRRC
jgi:hypothetical protein